MEVNPNVPVLRERITKWLNSKDRNFQSGLDLLKESGYQPAVTENLERTRNRADAPGKLAGQLHLYLRYQLNPINPIHKAELIDDVIEEVNVKVLTNIEKELENNEYPAEIKAILIEFQALYNKRSILHKQLKAVGEGNDDKSTLARKKILFVVDAISERMDLLWPAVEKYKADGSMPGAELLHGFDIEAVKYVEKVTPLDKNTKLVLADTLDELKKQGENWRTKIVKAENRLDYQSEKKAPKLNPMPEGPKRITQLKRIAQLKAEKESIDLAIANAK